MAVRIRLAGVAPEAGERRGRAGNADDLDLIEVRGQPVGECGGDRKRIVVREHDVGAMRAGDSAVVPFGQRSGVVDDDQLERLVSKGGAISRDAFVEPRAVDAADDE